MVESVAVLSGDLSFRREPVKASFEYVIVAADAVLVDDDVVVIALGRRVVAFYRLHNWGAGLRRRRRRRLRLRKEHCS